MRTSGPNFALILGGGCLVVLLLGAIGAAVFFMTVGALRGDPAPASAAPASSARTVAPVPAKPDAGAGSQPAPRPPPR